MRGLDFLNSNLSDAQNLRSLARLLQLECSLAIAEARFEDAVRSLQSGFRLAAVVGRYNNETVVTQLVSLALAGLMNYEVQTMLQLPDAPNLYWALASVPHQELYSPRAGIEGELLGVTRMLMPWTNDGMDLASESQSQTRLLALISHVRSYADGANKETAQTLVQDRLIAALAVGAFADRARLEIGKTDAGNCQAFIEWTTMGFQAAIEKVLKWSLLPLDLRLARSDLIDESLSGLVGLLDSPATALTMMILPSVHALDSAIARTQRQHALLITLEALRAYAAENSGALPESLEGLKPLPAWPDTSTGKPFDYQRTDLYHAVLHIQKSSGVPSEYHIEMRR